MKKKILFFMVIILLYNCQNNYVERVRINSSEIEQQFVLSDFPEKDKLILHHLNAETFLSELTNYKSYIFLNFPMSKNAIHVFSKENNKIIKKDLQIGSGPNEVLAVFGHGIVNDSIFWTYEGETSTIRFFNARDITDTALNAEVIEKITFDQKKNIFEFRIIPMNIKQFVLCASPVNKYKISIIDKNSQILSFMGKFHNLDFDNYIYLKNATHYLAAIKPDNKFIAIAYSYSDVIEIYDLKNYKLVKALHGPENILIEPAPTKENSAEQFRGNKKLKFTYYIKANNDYIFALYYGSFENKGLPWGDKLLIFDWTGKLIKYFILPEKIQFFTIDSPNNKIYFTTESGYLAFADFKI